MYKFFWGVNLFEPQWWHVFSHIHCQWTKGPDTWSMPVSWRFWFFQMRNGRRNGQKRAHCDCKLHIPWVVPPPNNSHHQDYEPFLVGNPNLNLHLPQASWGGTTQHIHPWKLRCWTVEPHPIYQSCLVVSTNQPLWKICCSSKWDHLPQGSGWKWQKMLVVEPTQLKNISQLGSYPQIFGMKITNPWKSLATIF